jgi:hypothetical protein
VTMRERAPHRVKWTWGLLKGDVELRKGAPLIMRGPHKVSCQCIKV